MGKNALRVINLLSLLIKCLREFFLTKQSVILMKQLTTMTVISYTGNAIFYLPKISEITVIWLTSTS